MAEFRSEIKVAYCWKFIKNFKKQIPLTRHTASGLAGEFSQLDEMYQEVI